MKHHLAKVRAYLYYSNGKFTKLLCELSYLYELNSQFTLSFLVGEKEMNAYVDGQIGQ